MLQERGRRAIINVLSPLRGWWGLLVKRFGRLVDKRPFSYAERKAGADGGLAVLAVEIRVVSLKPFGIEAAAVDILPRGLPAVPLEDFRSLLDHRALEFVGQGFGLCL